MMVVMVMIVVVLLLTSLNDCTADAENREENLLVSFYENVFRGELQRVFRSPRTVIEMHRTSPAERIGDIIVGCTNYAMGDTIGISSFLTF